MVMEGTIINESLNSFSPNEKFFIKILFLPVPLLDQIYFSLFLLVVLFVDREIFLGDCFSVGVVEVVI